MLQVGDLIEEQTEAGPVRSLVSCATAVEYTLLSYIVDGIHTKQHVPLEDVTEERFKVIANPIMDWPFLQTRYKNLQGVVHVFPQGRATHLVHLQDWVIADTQREKCSVYFNPNLKLRYLDTLILEYPPLNKLDTLRLFRATVPVNFVPFRQRHMIPKFKQKKPEVISTYQRLLLDDEEDEC